MWVSGMAIAATALIAPVRLRAETICVVSSFRARSNGGLLRPLGNMKLHAVATPFCNCAKSIQQC